MKKILTYLLSMTLVASLAIAGTVAYLTSEDSDVNVMTLGNVKIEQLEYERVVDENGSWISADQADKYGYTPDLLQQFTNAKPLYPAVFADGNIKWDDRKGTQNDSHQQSWGEVGASGSNQLFDDSVKNAQDKFVFVKNTGKSDAYVRTWIALEQGSVDGETIKNVIMTNTNKTHWEWELYDTDVEITDKEGKASKYYILSSVYKGPSSNPTGILAPGAVSYPSFLQVYMRPEATNEDVEAIDGNQNGTYDILVYSQAVQTEGFADAKTALNTAFGSDHPWTSDVEIPVVVSNAKELIEIVKELNAGYDSETKVNKSAHVILQNDIEFDQSSEFLFTESLNGAHLYLYHSDLTIDLNGHDIIVPSEAVMEGKTEATALFLVRYGKLDILGEGDIITENKAIPVYGWAHSEINIYGGNFKANSAARNESAVYVNNDSVQINVYGGTYTDSKYAFNAKDTVTKSVITLHEGIKFYEYNKPNSTTNLFDSDYKGGRIVVSEGYELSTIEDNGIILYEVISN